MTNHKPLVLAKKILFLSIPWLLGALLLFWQYAPELVVWPNKTLPHTYSDSITLDKGNSGIRLVSSQQNALTYEYMLGDHFIYPYVGVSFDADSGSAFIDLSSYDYAVVEIEAHLSRRIPLVLNQDIQGYSKFDEGATFMPLTKEIVYEKGKRSYELPLSQFETPSWWYSRQKLTETEVGKRNFTRIHNVQFHDCELLPKNVKETFTLYSVVFKKDMAFWYVSVFLIILLYYGAWFTLHYFSKPRKSILPRKQLDIFNLADEESKKVLLYLSENYSNADLSLETVQKDLGMSESKVSASIKEASGFNFKRYLNNVRLEEAKRLLLSTDRPIMDIAYKVGYGNISHFNRVFKEAEGCSPNEYRKNTNQKG